MYYTEMDPFTLKPVYIAKKLRDRRTQRALMQFFKPENYFEVREALREAGRQDLIGDGCDALIPATPPREALERRRREANEAMDGTYVHKIANPSKAKFKSRQSRPNHPQARTSSQNNSQNNQAQSKQAPSKQAQPRRSSSKQGRARNTKGYRPGRKGAQ
jgi:hypothetical protein